MRFITAIACAVLLLGIGAARAGALPDMTARQQRVSAVEAAILYHLAKYIQWEDEKEGGLLVCIYGNISLEDELRRLLEKKKSEGQLRLSSGEKSGASCDMAYFPQSRLKEYAAAVAAYRGRRVLFVSDAPDFIDKGGMVSLVKREGKIGIELNMQTLREAHFRVKPSLIEITTRVIK